MISTRDEEKASMSALGRPSDALVGEISFGTGDPLERAANGTPLAGKTVAQVLAALKVMDLLRSILGPDTALKECPASSEFEQLPPRLRDSLPAASVDPGRAGPDLRVGPVRLDRDTADVLVGNRPVRLTPAQFGILALLVANAGKTVRYEAIAREIWGTERPPSPHAIKLHMYHLRRRLGDTGAQSRIIGSVRGFGYKMLV
ncbi:MAG: winged helix-turn-helix transcriptional regulator [Chloroflexi bacterium]|nr:winged helix-turn-helix transcriptional regulator [Chloroflexota bacterium]